MINILMGTNNKGKFADAEYVAGMFEGVGVVRPIDLGIKEDAEETGQTYVENSRIKRDFFVAKLLELGIDDYYVVSDDSGIEIDALNGEPGIHSRRWRDGVTPMTDQEIVDYCLDRMKDVPEGSRGAAVAGNIAIGSLDRSLNVDIRYELRMTLLTQATGVEDIAGYPFRALLYLPEEGKLLKDIVGQGGERPEGFLSHREQGLKQAFSAIIDHATA